jgi:flagellar biosynthesis/type III secretory pathway M-ring protein FliF/YscJ
MGAPFGYGIWLWFRSNPAAQAVAFVVAVYIAFRLWLARKIRREREDAAEEAVEQVTEQIEKETDDAIQRVEDDRAAVRDLNNEQLRKLAEASPHNRGRLHRPETD